ncbi:MAG: hypothetical protein ACFFB3_09260 [Candidatus Hodarchaeota archaeon]
MPCTTKNSDILTWEELSAIIAQGDNNLVDDSRDNIVQILQRVLEFNSEVTPGHWSLNRAIAFMNQLRDQATILLLVLEEARAYRMLDQPPQRPEEKDPFEKLAKYENYLKNMTCY